MFELPEPLITILPVDVAFMAAVPFKYNAPDVAVTPAKLKVNVPLELVNDGLISALVLIAVKSPLSALILKVTLPLVAVVGTAAVPY